MSKVPPLRCDALSTTWNKTGFRGVERVRDKFRATLGDHSWRSPYYDSAVEAARAYDRKARQIYGRGFGYFNFPRKGESKVEPADPDRCRRGHDRSRHTYIRPDGRGQCRLCVALAPVLYTELPCAA